MHKVTYNRHLQILTILSNEYHKLSKKVFTYIEKKNISSIITWLEHNKNVLKDFNREQMVVLRKQEKDLLNLLNEYKWLNNYITMHKIMEYIKNNK